jgi:hypothetical protein
VTVAKFTDVLATSFDIARRIAVELAADREPDSAANTTNDADIRYLADLFEHVNQRVLDEVRNWDALNGVLLGTIVAVFVLFLDKVDSFTWIPIVGLSVPTILTLRNFGGRIWYSPDPNFFGPRFMVDPANAILNLIEDHKSDITRNAALRNVKRGGFVVAMVSLAIVCLAAAVLKQYTVHH